jgi:tRNA (cmo5U34)-methyltransferase
VTNKLVHKNRTRQGVGEDPSAPGEVHINATDENSDRLFAVKRPRASDFNFGPDTVAVFDDMVNRSVPFYGEIQRMVGELAVDFATPGSCIYDMGCATGTTFLACGYYLPRDLQVSFVGMDNSAEMLARAREKLEQARFPWTVAFQNADLNQPVAISNASVVLMVLTLQFVRPLERERLLREIYEGLNDHGCIIMVEKVLGESSLFNRQFIKHYYEMKKRNGYSEMEIAQKREALENVLIPYRVKENEQLLRRAGFQEVDVFFKWYNFCGLIAVKSREIHV